MLQALGGRAMAQLLVRGLDEAVIKRLKERAKRNARSLEAEARIILTEAERDPDAYARAVAFAARMRKKYAGKIKDDSTELIRQARDERWSE
jgi:plasmid stability protein